MKRLYAIALLFLGGFSSLSNAVETTVYGTITGIESRAWGFHIQTNFGGGKKLGCEVQAGNTYMYDLDMSKQQANADRVYSTLIAAFMGNREVSFHLYECQPDNTRPIIGHIRIR